MYTKHYYEIYKLKHNYHSCEEIIYIKTLASWLCCQLCDQSLEFTEVLLLLCRNVVLMFNLNLSLYQLTHCFYFKWKIVCSFSVQLHLFLFFFGKPAGVKHLHYYMYKNLLISHGWITWNFIKSPNILHIFIRK